MIIVCHNNNCVSTASVPFLLTHICMYMYIFQLPTYENISLLFYIKLWYWIHKQPILYLFILQMWYKHAFWLSAKVSCVIVNRFVLHCYNEGVILRPFCIDVSLVFDIIQTVAYWMYLEMSTVTMIHCMCTVARWFLLQ